MKKIFLLTLIGLSLLLNSQAEKFKGIIILKSDTIEVTFNIPVKYFEDEPNYEKLQSKVKYYDSKGKKVTLKPCNAKEFQFDYKNRKIRMVSKPNSLGLGNLFTMSDCIFLKLEIDGELKLFSYYDTRQRGGSYNSFTGGMTPGSSYCIVQDILQLGNGGLIRPKGINFKNSMSELFKKCPSLVEKIESKEFRKKELEELVRYYNSNCK